MRRFAVAVVAVAGLLPGPPPASAAPADRAAVSYAALLRVFAVDDGSQLFHERYPVAAGDNPYSYEWPFSQVHGATLDLPLDTFRAFSLRWNRFSALEISRG